MPIEIRELVIKAVVDNASQRKKEGDAAPSGNDRRDRKLEDIVNEVLEVLKENKNER
ncbi:MAG: hypothetical protein H6585_09665 [Flavobacteriales bacterium]|nr:hypothetical protein [Flavobacteriales bacterium]MCB9448597.1 hypothetical protein [Flavobacteriales bacterium]